MINKYQDKIHYIVLRGTIETPEPFENGINLKHYSPPQPHGWTSKDSEVLEQELKQAEVQHSRETMTLPLRQKEQVYKGAEDPVPQIHKEQWAGPESHVKMLDPPSCQTSIKFSGEPISLDKTSLKHEADTHLSNQNTETNK